MTQFGRLPILATLVLVLTSFTTSADSNGEPEEPVGLWVPHPVADAFETLLQDPSGSDINATVTAAARAAQPILEDFQENPSLDALTENFTYMSLSLDGEDVCVDTLDHPVCRSVCLNEPARTLYFPWFKQGQYREFGTGGVMEYTKDEHHDDGTVILTPSTGGAYGWAEWTFKLDGSPGGVQC